MANEVKLEVYSLRIRNSGDTTSFLPLDRFFNNSDFLTFFQEYISSFDHQLEVNDNQMRTLKLDSSSVHITSSNRMLSGIIESGDYGYESTIYHTGTGEERYRRQVDDTEIKPFYFLIYLPNNENKGFIILQRLGIYGIHSVFRIHLTNFFKSRFEALQLDFDPFVSRQLARAFIDRGNIKEFTLTRYNLPSDISERLGMIGHEEDIMSIELKIKAKRNKILPLNNRIRNFINNPNARIFTINELDSLGFDGTHKTKMKVELGGNTRMVDLSDTGQIRPYYDIDNEVQKDNTGHPIFESIDEIARTLITDLQQELGQ
jgi:hypothetical protein